MERRKHDRVVVNLNAAIVSDKAMPIGCRVRDVSSGGMCLHHEGYNKATALHDGATVEVRISLKQDDERKVIPLSMIVTREEENGIGAKFPEPRPLFLKLVEPYRLDKEASKVMAANLGSRGTTAADTANPVSENLLGDDTEKGNDRLFYIGLLSLVTAVGILLFNYADRTRLENRLSVLESTIDHHVNALPLQRSQNSPADNRAKELAELNVRVETLATTIAALKTQIAQDAQSATYSTTATVSTSGLTPPTQRPTNDKPATETFTQATTLNQSTSHDGPWGINLLTLYNKTAATQFTAEARAHGIRADTKQDTVRGKQVWRIQVSGFSTRDEASAYGDTTKEKLGLTSVWIFSNER